jgi:hypothetical protein
MNYTQAIELVEQLPRVLIPSDPTKIREVFAALVCVDGYRIAERAKRFLQQFGSGYRDGDLAGDDLRHRLTMDLFRDSVIDLLEEKPTDIEPAVEHDIDTWIDANAAAVAEANLVRMEAALATDSAYVAQDRVALRQNVDFDACEAEQRRVLDETWASIERDVDAFLAAAR